MSGEENNLIKVQRSADRLYVRNGAVKVWKTFDPGSPAGPLHEGFRSLESLNEISLPPETGFKIHLDENHDVLSYVREGDLLVGNGPQEDERLGPGSFQSAGSDPWMTTRVPKMPSSQRTHLFLSSMRITPTEVEAPCEEKRFPFADRHGKLRLVASGTGEAASLRLRQDVRLYSSLIEKGHHVVHELRPGRAAWFHLVAGRVRLFDHILETGDGASIEEEVAVSFSAQEASEFLLFDLA